LILIRPLGFSLSEKAVRRAGMDYWQHVDLLEYDDWDAFMADQQPPHDRMYLFEEHGQETFYAPAYHPEGYLIFGCESKGLPPEVLTGRADRTYRLPMRDARVRSLNLANVATAVAYQALRDSFTG
jgi:tRNA (cytidine/uridine-2'-O-)-methyltransferase